ncbi:MAG: hypothetical protein KGL46_05750 [Hyphomicrobiales bacterium]|nr:hypothetical protein [Hyphomicrobiales bacterium]
MRFPLFLLLLAALFGPPAVAQTSFGPPGAAVSPPPQTAPQATLSLSATLAPNDREPVRGGLKWRIFEERAQADGSHALVYQTEDATPQIQIAQGAYIVHAAFGLAGAEKRVNVAGPAVSERLTLNAGALKATGMLGDTPAPPNRIQIALYVPQSGNSEAKLVLEKGRPGDVICLPEGAYHVVSTLFDTGANTPGAAATATNSVAAGDVRVQAGKLTEVTLRHRAATMTLKLVNAPGGEALANTTFSVLTPGGDVIRELIGAFPSLVLAEGEYVAIARHDGKTYQSVFKVQSTMDRDVEVLAQDKNDKQGEKPAEPPAD